MLVRHGETDDNREPVRVQGRRDVPLNSIGRAQAKALATRLRKCPQRPAALYCSPLVRSQDTARVIGDALGLAPRVDPRLAESFRGEWEGRTWRDIERADPLGFAAWRAAGPGFRFPGGESLVEHSARVAQALADVAAAGTLPALVVCHGGSIRVALCDARRRGLGAFHDWEVPNGALIWL